MRLSLVQKAYKLALEKGDKTLLIFLLKNKCGFSDNPAMNFTSEDEEDFEELDLN